jgi:hypothetical protein
LVSSVWVLSGMGDPHSERDRSGRRRRLAWRSLLVRWRHLLRVTSASGRVTVWLRDPRWFLRGVLAAGPREA